MITQQPQRREAVRARSLIAAHYCAIMHARMKIYTKTGDDGSTGLLGGSRVQKSHPRIECYGTVDELNAAIGWAAVASTSAADLLRPIQNELFVIGSHLAVGEGSASPATLPALEESAIGRMEMQIDTATAELPPLRNFVLPGGCELAARLHVARTICRRAERLVVGFAQDRPIAPIIITYLNRLSDWLFVQARLANQQAGVADIPWTHR
jgi:cob(I)alamin adenosyltransferase